jgi:hypothetical protein
VRRFTKNLRIKHGASGTRYAVPSCWVFGYLMALFRLQKLYAFEYEVYIIQRLFCCSSVELAIAKTELLLRCQAGRDGKEDGRHAHVKVPIPVTAINMAVNVSKGSCFESAHCITLHIYIHILC